MVLYEINYDLIGGQKRRDDYIRLEQRIEDVGDARHIEYSTWFVEADASLPMLDAYLRSGLRRNDRMTVKPAAKVMTASGIGQSHLSWLISHGVQILPPITAAVGLVTQFERKIAMRKELRVRAIAFGAAYAAHEAAARRSSLAPLPVPILRYESAPVKQDLLGAIIVSKRLS